MKFRDKISNMFSRFTNNSFTEEELLLFKALGVDTSDIKKDVKSEVTYFTCLKVLSETLGKLPLKLYQETEKGVKLVNDDVFNLIKLRPNPYMDATTFWNTVENNRNHYGNSYVYCNWNGAKLKDLWVLSPESVRVMCDNKGYFGKDNAIWYIYNDSKTGKEYVINKDNILHFKTSHTFDGITGIPVKDILSSTIDGTNEQQNFLNNLYKNGMTSRAILEYTGDLSEKAIERFMKGIESKAYGSLNAGKIIPIPVGTSLKPLDLKLTDSQFFDLKKYSSLQIASAFGIKPTFINNYDKSSYSNSEMEQLSFLINTLQYILKHYEEEITYKLLTRSKTAKGYFFKFNEGALLRTDIKTQSEVLVSLTNNAIKTPNECRLMLNLPTIEGADRLMCNGNYIPLDMIGKQYMKEGDLNNEKQQE